MPINADENLVGSLRLRTEEEDLKQYLKKTLGGYTKKSVTEYLSALRRQQQAATETFSQNKRLLLEEKENLQAENERLALKIAQTESDYQCLTDTLKIHNLENTTFTIDDIVSLKNHGAALQAELREQQKNRYDLEKQIERLKIKTAEMETELEKSKQETRIQKELLASEKLVSKEQRELVSEYSGLSEELRAEVLYLKELAAEGQTAKLKGQISELMATITLQENIVADLKEQLTEKDRQIESLNEENKAQRQNIEHLSGTLSGLLTQNEKLAAVQDELSKALEAEHQKALQLLTEKAKETVDKLIISRRLADIQVKLSLAELGSGKTRKDESAEITD